MRRARTQLEGIDRIQDGVRLVKLDYTRGAQRMPLYVGRYAEILIPSIGRNITVPIENREAFEGEFNDMMEIMS